MEETAAVENAGPPEKLKNKEYLKELRRLQAEICRLQDWVRQTGERAVVDLGSGGGGGAPRDARRPA